MRAIRSRATYAWVSLAVVLTALAQVELWLVWQPDLDEATGPVPFGVRALAAAAALPLTLSLALGGRLPLVPLALAIPAIGALPGGPLEVSVAVAAAIVVASFRAAMLAAGPLEIGLGASGIAALLVATAIAHPETVEESGDIALLVAFLGGPWLAGLAIRTRAEREAELEAGAARAEASRRADTLHAVADERARIARELHDVVAHAISVIVLQSRGGRRAIDQDPAAAAQALVDIELTGSRALAEMRRLVGVLRPDDAPCDRESVGLEPPPGLGQLDGLVARVRDAGLDVRVRTDGSPVELAPGVDLAAYRLIQEALTNTLRHADGPAVEVVLRYVPGAIELEVIDEGGPAPTKRAGRPTAAAAGHGMIGMRERAALYGGSVEFGPRPEGGFRVSARLPVGGGPG